MQASFEALFALGLMIGGQWTTDMVSSKDGNIVLEDASGHATKLTESGIDSDPWLSRDGKTVLFVRGSVDDMFRTSIYEIALNDRTPRLLYTGPVKYAGREGSYFGRPELNASHDALYIISKEYATEGSLISIDLATGHAKLISDHVVGYDVVECSRYRGDLIALKRHNDILGHPFFLYWLYSPSGEELGLAGDGELDVDLAALRSGRCQTLESLPTTSLQPIRPSGTSVIQIESSVMDRRLVKHVEATYPSEARSKHIQGDVNLSVQIATNGTVQEVSLVSGPPQLVEAAIAAVKQWTYRPIPGYSGPVVTLVKVPFRLP